jgi:RNA polymerase sigma factor (sigma-70 family)
MPDSDSPIPPREVFATTRWTVVVHAQQGDSTEAREALETLCRAYWYPLYAFVRRQGVMPEDAQDLTQSFFERLIEKNFLADVQREKGRFRSFLLAALKHFLANEWDKARAQKRGGGAVHVPIDTASAETRYGLEPAHFDTPERLFERRWAITLLDRVLERLRDEHVKAGKAELFEQLKPCLTAEKAALSYAELGARVGLSEGAVKVAVHRLRQRYRELLRAEIAETVDSPAEVEDELRHLFTALSA